MDGFVLGLAIFVSVGQLYKLFGVAKPEGNTIEKFLGIDKELPQANWVTFLVGASALALQNYTITLNSGVEVSP